MLSTKIDRRAPGRGTAVAVVAVVAIVMMLVAGVTPSAQSNALSVQGRVFDPSGGVLPGASVALVDANKISWPTTTDRTGQFTFEPVGAGPYVLEVSLPGFKTLRHEFDLASATGRTHTVTMQVGALEETIRVSAKRPAARAATPTRTAPVRMGGNIRQPYKLLDVRPVYPEAMREAGLEGIVPMEAVIGVDGSVVSVHLSSAQINPEFAASAVTAVRQWRFSPTLLNGVPVEVQMSVSISFSLTD
jgi:TonB family protein